MSLAFIACVERGYLEEQTKLLCRTIRRFAGRFSSAPIHTFQPRLGTQIKELTQSALEELDVIHHTVTLNTEFRECAFGNKVFVCDWAERNLTEDVLVFLDSDTVMIGEPADLLLEERVDAAVRPADSILLNSTGPGHQMDQYWLKAYKICGAENEPFVETELERRVRAYFSSGLIAVRRSAGLFGQWKSDFLRLVKAGHIPAHTGIDRMDEVALAVTLSRAFERVRILDGRYNYLIYRRHHLSDRWRAAPLAELIHIHYRNAFDEPGYLRSVVPALDPRDQVFQWLEPWLPLKTTTD